MFARFVLLVALVLTFATPASAEAWFRTWSATEEEEAAASAAISSGNLRSLTVHHTYTKEQNQGELDYAYGRKVIESDKIRISIDGCVLQHGARLEILGMVSDIEAKSETDKSMVLVRYHNSDVYEDGVDKFDCGDGKLLMVRFYYFPTLIREAKRHETGWAFTIGQIEKILGR